MLLKNRGTCYTTLHLLAAIVLPALYDMSTSFEAPQFAASLPWPRHFLRHQPRLPLVQSVNERPRRLDAVLSPDLSPGPESRPDFCGTVGTCEPISTTHRGILCESSGHKVCRQFPSQHRTTLCSNNILLWVACRSDRTRLQRESFHTEPLSSLQLCQPS